jgi:hypothetical protein
LLAPIFFTSALTVDLPARGQFADWEATARWCFLPIALYLLAAPFVYRFFRPVSNRFLAANMEGAEGLLFLLATSGPLAVVGLAYIIVFFAGASPAELHGWAAVSLIVSIFWCWWYRNLLT